MYERHYESVVILNAALEDAQIENTLNRIEEIINTGGGEVTDVEKWGRKRLAYPIKKSKSGYYAVYRFKVKPNLISDLERMYRLDESIIRYLTSLLDQRDLEHYEQLKKQKEKEAELQESENRESEAEPQQSEASPEKTENVESAEDKSEESDDNNK